MSPLGKRRVVTAGDAINVLLVDLCGNLKGETGTEREREAAVSCWWSNAARNTPLPSSNATAAVVSSRSPWTPQHIRRSLMWQWALLPCSNHHQGTPALTSADCQPLMKSCYVLYHVFLLQKRVTTSISCSFTCYHKKRNVYSSFYAVISKEKSNLTL